MKEGESPPAALARMTAGCCWRKCYCYDIDDRALGHKMRECKGCMNIWYCGKRCQQA